MTEPDVSDLMTVEQAMAIIDAAAIARRSQRIPLAQSLGLYLAEDLHGNRDAPPFDKSLMDGYAVQAREIATVPCELTVVDRIAAGTAATTALRLGQAMAIMTGGSHPPARMPSCRSNIPRRLPPPIVSSSCKPFPKADSSPRAQRLPGRFGRPEIRHAPRPSPDRGGGRHRGGECPHYSPRLPSRSWAPATNWSRRSKLPPPPRFAPATILCCWRFCNRYPARPTDLGLVPDDPAAIEAKIKSGLTHDVLLITGGMSMGERDFVPGILRRLHGDLKITKLRIKPGKPFVFAQMPGGKFVFGLPGNPVSAFVCTVCLVSRLVNRMAGGPPAEPARTAPLAQPLEANGPRTFYQPAIFDGRLLTPLRWKGSADIYTLSQANALLIRPENQPPQSAGATIEFMEI